MNSKPIILVTDSGLGGLSVMSNIQKRIDETPVFDDYTLIFVDALFDNNSGYNRIKDHNKKVEIFNLSLYGMYNEFEPDYLFIACNTLSVLYPETEFSKKNRVKVVGIVEFGVDLIEKRLVPDKNSQVIIFATETTIFAQTHKKELLKRRVGEEQIITKACPHLASYIENSPEGKETFKLIKKYVSEVIPEIKNSDKLAISLNCTHYGYSHKLWVQAFAEEGIEVQAVLNPNSEMSSILFRNKISKNTLPEFTIGVVSKVKMQNENRQSMIRLFENENPIIAKALEHYEYMPDLF